MKNNVWIVVGTRPEAIKQIPLYLHLKEARADLNVQLVSTGQHSTLLSPVLEQFQVKAELTAELSLEGSPNLGILNARILESMSALSAKHLPRLIIVQGDTATASMSALAAFYSRIPVAHNEAGLRSYNLNHPYPEEANRKVISAIANLHLCPTSLAENALLKENVSQSQIEVVGNTGIDALRLALNEKPSGRISELDPDKNKGQFVLVTAHRRENSSGMETWFAAIREFILSHPGLEWVYPFHPNNLAREVAARLLGDLSGVHIVPPLDYFDTAHLLRMCKFIVTDSGGIQEEAATLGVPTVICRETTERPEVLQWGTGKLCGTETDAVIKGMGWANHQPHKTAFSENGPFGTGYSSQNITAALTKHGLI